MSDKPSLGARFSRAFTFVSTIYPLTTVITSMVVGSGLFVGLTVALGSVAKHLFPEVFAHDTAPIVGAVLLAAATLVAVCTKYFVQMTSSFVREFTR